MVYMECCACGDGAAAAAAAAVGGRRRELPPGELFSRAKKNEEQNRARGLHGIAAKPAPTTACALCDCNCRKFRTTAVACSSSRSDISVCTTCDRNSKFYFLAQRHTCTHNDERARSGALPQRLAYHALWLACPEHASVPRHRADWLRWAGVAWTGTPVPDDVGRIS